MTTTTPPFEPHTLAGADAAAGETARQFRAALGQGGLMTLGARHLHAVPGSHQLGGLLFTASILPMTRAGGRAERPRRMAVMFSLTAADLIDVEVRRYSDGQQHAHVAGIYIDQLQRLAVALDYDGPEVLNPDYWPN